MRTEQSIPNGTRSFYSERTIAKEFHESVLPQITGLLSDAEEVLRSEARLVEAKISDRVVRVEKRIIFSALGAGALLLALGLFIFTVVYCVTDLYPEIPVWAVTGGLSVLTCIIGAVLLQGPPRRNKGE